jgi:opacity protein-like surface antigen
MMRTPVVAGMRGLRRATQRMKKLFALVAIAAIGTPAIADDMAAFYGGIGGGVYKLDNSVFDDTAATTRIIGGYRFSQHFAVDASYSRLFETSESAGNTRLDVDGNVWDLGARFSYPVSSRFSPYGRLGWSYIDASAVLNDDGDRTRLNNYEDAFTWAVGAEYGLTRRLALGGEYSRSMIDDGDLDFLSMNVSYRFGIH